MAGVFLAGRLIVGGYFFYNGLNHWLMQGVMTQAAAAKGVPLPDVAVFFAGCLIAFGGLSIALGWRPELGIAAIVLFLIPVTLFMHNFWAISNPSQRMMEMAHFLKNFALMGSVMMLVAIPQPWPHSISTHRRRLLV